MHAARSVVGVRGCLEKQVVFASHVGRPKHKRAMIGGALDGDVFLGKKVGGQSTGVRRRGGTHFLESAACPSLFRCVGALDSVYVCHRMYVFAERACDIVAIFYFHIS